jgi:hypothetical protein
MSSVLQLVSALAVSENVVQLQFTTPVYFSQYLDFQDGSDRTKYTITPVAGTIGLDGTAARPIATTTIVQADTPGVLRGQTLLVTTDRPMTPSPAQYVIACQNLWSADLTSEILSSASTAQFFAVFKVMAPPQLQTLSRRGDFANPQDLEMVQQGISVNPTAIQLGCFSIDATGDYAVESGLVGYKKRLLRRIMSSPGAFLHLGQQYGAGVRQYGKRLMSAQTRAQLIAAVEVQVALEPETAKVSVKTVIDVNNPGLLYLVVLAQTKTGKTLKIVTGINAST